MEPAGGSKTQRLGRCGRETRPGWHAPTPRLLLGGTSPLHRSTLRLVSLPAEDPHSGRCVREPPNRRPTRCDMALAAPPPARSAARRFWKDGILRGHQRLATPPRPPRPRHRHREFLEAPRGVRPGPTCSWEPSLQDGRGHEHCPLHRAPSSGTAPAGGGCGRRGGDQERQGASAGFALRCRLRKWRPWPLEKTGTSPRGREPHPLSIRRQEALGV